MKKIVLGSVVGLFVGLGLSSCTTPMPSVVLAPPSVEKALYGKTTQELLACAAVHPFERDYSSQSSGFAQTLAGVGLSEPE